MPASPTAVAAPSTTLIGSISYVYKSRRVLAVHAYVIACDPSVHVDNVNGFFVMLGLRPGTTYTLVSHNGPVQQTWEVTPKEGDNVVELVTRPPLVPVPPRTPTAKVVKPNIVARPKGRAGK